MGRGRPERRARARNQNAYEVLIVASMIERETAAPEERRLVSAVIHNRLKLGMALGIDATLRYGLGIPGTRPLTKAQLANRTPYNTRIHRGLPPTPIANPGVPSMRAAARPAPRNYLYYLRRPRPRRSSARRRASGATPTTANPRGRPVGPWWAASARWRSTQSRLASATRS